IRDFHVTGVQTCALPIWIGGTNQPTSLGGPGPLSRGLRFCGGGHGWISGVPRRGKAFPRTRREARQPLTAPGAWLPEPEPAFPRSEERRVGNEESTGSQA